MIPAGFVSLIPNSCAGIDAQGTPCRCEHREYLPTRTPKGDCRSQRIPAGNSESSIEGTAHYGFTGHLPMEDGHVRSRRFDHSGPIGNHRHRRTACHLDRRSRGPGTAPCRPCGTLRCNDRKPNEPFRQMDPDDPAKRQLLGRSQGRERRTSRRSTSAPGKVPFVPERACPRAGWMRPARRYVSLVAQRADAALCPRHRSLRGTPGGAGLSSVPSPLTTSAARRSRR